MHNTTQQEHGVATYSSTGLLQVGGLDLLVGLNDGEQLGNGVLGSGAGELHSRVATTRLLVAAGNTAHGEKQSNADKNTHKKGSAIVPATGEDDKLCLVLLQAVHVGHHRTHRAVLTAVVNRDADSLGKLGVDASELQLLKGEATASAHTAVVAGGLAADHRAQAVHGARSDSGGLGGARGTAGLLLLGLCNGGDATCGEGMNWGWVGRECRRHSTRTTHTAHTAPLRHQGYDKSTATPNNAPG